MALIDIIRSGVKIASNVTQSLKGTVTWTPWIGEDGEGADVFGSPIELLALIDPKQERRMTTGGTLVMTFATLTILDPITAVTPNAGFERFGAIDTRDKLVLPGGGTAPVVEAGGFLDAGTSVGFIGEITLGVILRGQ